MSNTISTSSSINNRIPFPIEIIYETLKYLRIDYNALLACILTCRAWAECALTFYWRDPFVHMDPRLLVSSYIRCLDEYKCARYNYTCFCENLSMQKLRDSIKEYLKYKDTQEGDSEVSAKDSNQKLDELCFSILRNILKDQANNMKISLDWCQLTSWKQFFDVYFDKGSKCIYQNIKKLSLNYIYDTQLFHTLATTSLNIKALEIHTAIDNLTSDNLRSLISNQNELRELKLIGYLHIPFVALAEQADFLFSIELVYIDFSYAPSCLLKGLASCHQLRKISIKYCTSANDGLLEPLASSRFLNLRTIYVEESMEGWNKLMLSLIRNKPSNLEEIYYKPSSDDLSIMNGQKTTDMIKVVGKSCPFIKNLSVPAISQDDFESLKLFLEDSHRNLQSIDIFMHKTNKNSVPTTRYNLKLIYLE
ncbi:9208_t:CDS:1 [Ambispora gerdemannii]|uniref:9208_t:CDS:1 n=1 Tax=Ambispora gerdemannii TaxID=144530 RepID=A0A9N8Z6F2_9GLOM|nr:9208_t:CDS:1 [Ambispora gerdemannii]